MNDLSIAIENAMGTASRGAYQVMEIAAYEQMRPSVLFRPALSLDGNKYCALYGENLQEGCAGFGDSPELAMIDFDKNWNTKLRVPGR